jgi:NADH-quinone oxidoreductase subunit C
VSAFEVADLLAVAGDGASVEQAFDGTTIDVPAPRWEAAALGFRDDPRTECRFFDWLSAYDDLDHGIAIVAHVWSRAHRQSVLLRTHVERTDPQLGSLTGVWAGADWHERETFEMFGVVFTGHPNLVPLLLPDGFEGHPLRKEFVLASRVAKPWPGVVEPGRPEEKGGSGAARRSRRRPVPPGVPADWGPGSE